MLKLRSPQTAHQEFWEHNNCPHVYTYDPTDEGPECAVAKAILATHTLVDLEEEWLELAWRDIDARADEINTH